MLAGELALRRSRQRRSRAGPGARAPRRARSRSGAGGCRRSPALAALSGAGARRAGRLARLLDDRAAARRTLPSASILAGARRTPPSTAPPRRRSRRLLAMPVSALALRHRNRADGPDRAARLPADGAARASWSRSGSSPSRCATRSRSTRARFELIVAYAILFLPLAVVGVRSAMAQALAAPGGGRPLARRRPADGVPARDAAADRPGPRRRRSRWCSSPRATELTATLLLRPTGVNTLATQFWTLHDRLLLRRRRALRGADGAISAVPAYLLSRRMSRARRHRASAP